jgi:hypothetical protein
LPQAARRRADDQTPGPWYRKVRGIPTTDQMNSGEDLPDGEAELRVRMGDLHTGPGFLCLAGRTPPRGRGDVIGYGFHPGTDALATCLQRESLARRYAIAPSVRYWGYGGY